MDVPNGWVGGTVSPVLYDTSDLNKLQTLTRIVRITVSKSLNLIIAKACNDSSFFKGKDDGASSSDGSFHPWADSYMHNDQIPPIPIPAAQPNNQYLHPTALQPVSPIIRGPRHNPLTHLQSSPAHQPTILLPHNPAAVPGPTPYR